MVKGLDDKSKLAGAAPTELFNAKPAGMPGMTDLGDLTKKLQDMLSAAPVTQKEQKEPSKEQGLLFGFEKSMKAPKTLKPQPGQSEKLENENENKTEVTSKIPKLRRP